jgi:signal peptide peptidase SppA
MNPTIAEILAELRRTPLAMDASYVVHLTRTLTAALDSDDTVEDLSAALSDVLAAGRDRAVAAGGDTIAVVPVMGPISHRESAFTRYFGWPTTEGISGAVAAAVADPAIKAVVLDIASPGGSVHGCRECFDAIHALRGAKPIVAVANAYAASAAYYIASAADAIVVTPSGQVGSIGVWTAHVDYSEAYKSAGIEINLISAGKYKVEGNPYEPLSDEARNAIQAEVDQYYADFLKAVSKGRGVSVTAARGRFGEGRMRLADEAVASGMADKVMTFGDVVSALASGRLRLPSRNAEGELMEPLAVIPADDAPAVPVPAGFDDFDLRQRRQRLLSY